MTSNYGYSRNFLRAANLEVDTIDIQPGGSINIGGESLISTYSDGGTGQNLFVGEDAGNKTLASTGPATEASRNTGVGYAALNSLTTGGLNTSTGHNTLTAVTTGANNVAVGDGAGDAITTGDGNVCVGQNTASTLTTGDNNIVIGTGADVTAAGAQYELNIGDMITGNADPAGSTDPGATNSQQVNIATRLDVNDLSLFGAGAGSWGTINAGGTRSGSANTIYGYRMRQSVSNQTGAVRFNSNEMVMSGTSGSSSAQAVNGQLIVSNTSTAANYQPFAARCDMTGSSAAASVCLFGGHFEGSGTGTITEFVGVNPVATFGGATNNTITQAYGVKIENIRRTYTHTNTPFGLWVGEQNVNNYFAGNVGVGTPTQFGSGTGVVAFADVSAIAGLAAPTTNGTNCGQLYCDGGALVYRSPAGTVTTVAPN